MKTNQCIFFNPKTTFTLVYFDFGRYDRPDLKKKGIKRGGAEGAVRSSKNYSGLSLPDWDSKKTDKENTTNILTAIHNSPIFKGYGRTMGALANNVNYGAMLSYARYAEDEGYRAFGGYHNGYDVCSQATYCAKFARGVGAAGGIDWGWNTFTGQGNVNDIHEDYGTDIITIAPTIK